MLTPGLKLGTYEILGSLGAGGMGEVYRGRDTKLGREVAVKIIPELFAADPERIARFEREAQLLAALNHPHIGAIYGVEESPHGRFLVLELVDGESLADRLSREAPRGLPLDEALRIARQIIDALQAAHEKGIVHRDLKPANIMLTADGQVKVLDFGLARAIENESSSSVVNSPTLTAATQAGVILGTAAYMSPEQAKGRVADKRSDVWAFGCVLYEMLAGKRAFEGEDVSDTLAAILRGEPDWSAIPSHVPPHVDRIVRRCLLKDRKARIPDVSVIEYLLSEPPAVPADAAAAPRATRVPRRQALAMIVIGLVAGAALTAAAWWGITRGTPAAAPQPMRFVLVPPPNQAVTYSPIDRTVAISPGGTHIAYVGRAAGGDTQLFVRRIDQLNAVGLAGTGSARYPFFSNDGRWIAFFLAGELKKVSITGGPSMTVSRIAGGIRGGTWTKSNTIIYSTNDPTTGLMTVPAAGGEPRVLTKPQPGEDHFQPSILPDDRRVLFTIFKTGAAESAQIGLADLQTGEYRIVLRGGSAPEYVDTGHLVHAVAGSLRAVRFDAARGEIASDPAAVEEGVLTLGSTGAANYAVSHNGHLVFTPGTDSGTRRSVVWVYRDGREEQLKVEPRVYTYTRLSPDGTRVALEVRDQEQDIWIFDLARQTSSRLTFDPAADLSPVWAPDGRRIVFQSARGGPPNIYRQAADGTGVAEQLTKSTANMQVPYSLSTDGQHLVFGETRAASGWDLFVLRLDGKSEPQPLIASASVEGNAELSPDGQWVAFQSNESGSLQIYVRPFPQVESGRWQISPTGGTRPAWSKDGKELFYMDPNGAMMSVAIDAGDAFRPGNPVRLFATRYYFGVATRPYDVSADGKRFLMIKDPDAEQSGSSAGMVVVLNWIEELKAKLPAK